LLIFPRFTVKSVVYGFVWLYVVSQMGCTATPNDAGRLTRAMQLDRAVLLGYWLPLKQAQALMSAQSKADEQQAKFFKCLGAINASIFTPTLADHFNKNMSADELSKATAFFESGPGKKYVQQDLSQLPEYLKMPPQAELPGATLTPEESASAQAFAKTPAGLKTIGQSLMQDSAIQKSLLTTWEQAVEVCRRTA
jgi:hypothetical protein